MTLTVLLTLLASVAEPSAAERGRDALIKKAFIPAFWPKAAYDNAWRTWGVDGKPKDYDAAFRERYGLSKAPYANDGLPMGLRMAPYLPIARGIGIDCMTCHGSSLLGESRIGLGNSSLDIQAVFEELAGGVDMQTRLPFQFSHARGTNEAGAFSVYLLGYRNDDLTLRADRRDLGLHDDSCEDVPAWWLLKKKKTMYYIGATDTNAVRSIMQFMMHPLTVPRDFEKAEPDFKNIIEYIKTIEPPKYPFPIDRQAALQGHAVFNDNCAKCHGTYGEKWTYPNKIIPLDEIGTDPKRYHNINEKFGAAYNASWFAKGFEPQRATVGYQAPPLDGIWASAPYFHNGSVPTLAGVLNSKTRPRIFTRSYRTDKDDYDTVHVGWKIRESKPAAKPLASFDARKIYDTTKPGRSNRGHTYGDDLSNDDRMKLLEYLKTL